MGKPVVFGPNMSNFPQVGGAPNFSRQGGAYTSQLGTAFGTNHRRICWGSEPRAEIGTTRSCGVVRQMAGA